MKKETQEQKTSEELKNALLKDVYGAFGLGPCSFIDSQIKATLEEYGCVFDRNNAAHVVGRALCGVKTQIQHDKT